MLNKKVAYLCMEYGLSSDFRIYSGGLGILAGDIVKTAKDLALPMTFIGILWNQGYAAQKVDENGNVYDVPTHNDWEKYVEDTGKTVYVNIQNRNVLLKIWKHKEYSLYLLDSNLPENEGFAYLTSRLYGSNRSDEENKWERIAQEMILGIGGVYALQALGINVDLYHFNEGHPVFAGFALISEKIRQGYSFEDAWNAVKKMIVFTTHTPVPAGNESHNLGMLMSMCANCALSYEQLSMLGGDPFGMTVAALRLSRMTNAVAKLHTCTAQDMWKWVDNASPIITVTNGVHQGTWQDPNINSIFNNGVFTELYDAHMICKKQLIQIIKEKTGKQLRENSLLVGFARRATEYKRWLLIFNDIQRLEKLINDYDIQFVFSGNSHCRDGSGKHYISVVSQMSKRYPDNVIFLEGYNMSISKPLVAGADIWLNNPRRPLEACGTSGMKAAMNGVLNVSILDGWWDEACIDGVNGWAISDQYIGDNQDERDAGSLYNVLEQKVLPTYSNKIKWSQMMYASILTSENFTGKRMLQDYCINMYNL